MSEVTNDTALKKKRKCKDSEKEVEEQVKKIRKKPGRKPKVNPEAARISASTIEVQKSKIGLGTKRPASSSININHTVKRQKVPQIELPTPPTPQTPRTQKSLHQTTLAVSTQIQEYEHDPKLANEMSEQ